MATRRRYKYWTKEEEQYLEDNWGKRNIKYMARKMKRSISSLERKAYRMELGGVTLVGHTISISDLSRAINVNANTIRNWIKTKNLKAKYIKLTKRRSAYQIKIDDFWEWAYYNQDKINTYNIEPNILGIEPQWLIDKRKADYKIKNNNKDFSSKEIATIKSSYKTMTYKEIATAINRTESAVKTFISRNKLNKRKSRKWTKEEENLLLELKNNGKTNKEIASALNRSVSSIEYKCLKMKGN